MTRLAVTGATGHMGRAVIDAATERGDTVVLAVSESADSVEGAATTVDGDGLADALRERGVEVLVDFTVPESAVGYVEACATAGVPVVTGTTGFEDDGLERLEAAGADVPVLKAANFARGVQALLRAVRSAVAALPGYDVELTETHHNRKRDAPSGTAKTILREIEDGRDDIGARVYGREGIQPREADEVGVHVRRAGDVHGEHEVMLAGNDEVVTLEHRAESRGVFAAGALDAADWLRGGEPGFYGFDDVLDGDETDENADGDSQ